VQAKTEWEREKDALTLEIAAMKDCESCTEYIKKMKSLEFKVNDVIRERDLVRNECTALSSQLAQTDRED
jgi:hypothetical protein